jgi:hypothetical protein
MEPVPARRALPRDVPRLRVTGVGGRSSERDGAPMSNGQTRALALRRGMLDVGHANLVYWATRGHPDGKPALIVHGGPGTLRIERGFGGGSAALRPGRVRGRVPASRHGGRARRQVVSRPGSTRAGVLGGRLRAGDRPSGRGPGRRGPHGPAALAPARSQRARHVLQSGLLARRQAARLRSHERGRAGRDATRSGRLPSSRRTEAASRSCSTTRRW